MSPTSARESPAPSAMSIPRCGMGSPAMPIPSSATASSPCSKPRAASAKAAAGRPLPVLVERGGATVGAAPAYLKTHSQGEYVFDHGWAQAWEQAGGDYYPKLQVTVPFTPCPGAACSETSPPPCSPRLRASPSRTNFVRPRHLLHARGVAAATSRGWLERHGLQYHWHNRDYADFDGFLGALSSRKRKAIRKERAAAVEGLEILTLRGAEIEPAHWDAMWHFYQDTGLRKWGQPYLTRAFFDQVGAAMGDRQPAVSRASRRPAHRRRAQLHRRGHALRPLLGRGRGGAVPPLRIKLLSRHRLGDRA